MKRLIFIPLLLFTFICSSQEFSKSGTKFMKSGNNFMSGPMVPAVAGYPQILAGTVTGELASNMNYCDVTMPSGAAVGNLIIVYIACDGGETFAISTAESGLNWTIESQVSYSTAVTGAVIWKIAEASNALRVTINAGDYQMYSWASYRLSGHNVANPLTVTNATSGTGVDYNPPANTGEYGAVNYLWMVFAAVDATNIASVAPADFSNLITVQHSNSAGASCSLATREYNTGAAYDPGAFTGSTGGRATFTIIINPTL